MTDYKASKIINGTSAERTGNIDYSQLQDDGTKSICANTYYGGKLNSSIFHGKTISSVTFYAYNGSSAWTGTLTCTLADEVGNSIGVIGTGSYTIGTSETELTFNTTARTLPSGKKGFVMLTVSGACDSGNNNIKAMESSTPTNDDIIWCAGNAFNSLTEYSSVFPMIKVNYNGGTGANNAQTYSIFSETDTGKDFLFGSDGNWTEVA